MKLARVRLDDGTVTFASVLDDGVRIAGGDDGIDRLIELLLGHAAQEHGELVPLDAVRLLAPIERPPSIRDFMVFEDHVANARQRTGRDVPKAWYAAPAFYFTNPAAVIGPGDEVPLPRGCRALDLELEVACVIGREVSDLDTDDPACLDAIAGFMLMNDWSARDLQVSEMPVGLGPVKGKDFATSLGPWVVTKDELKETSPGRWAGEVEATVNGRRIGGADLVTATFGWHEIVARASANTRLLPGDVLGSGTVGTGCILEQRELGFRDQNPWLRAGDVVELSGGPLGTLRNRVVATRSTTN